MNRPTFTGPGLPCWSPIQALTEVDVSTWMGEHQGKLHNYVNANATQSISKSLEFKYATKGEHKFTNYKIEKYFDQTYYCEHSCI